MNNKKNRPGIIAVISLFFISSLVLSYIPFQIFFNSSGSTCCESYNDSAKENSNKITVSKTCPCCGGLCRCAFKEKPAGDFPSTAIKRTYPIPDLSSMWINSSGYNNYHRLIFKETFSGINTWGFRDKVPIYRLKSSMLC